METFSGKTVVITGAASGIGLAVARATLREGARLVLGDIEGETLDAVVAELDPTRTRVIGLPCDVSCREDLERLAGAALETFGAIHVAVNNAGVGSGGLSWELSQAEWEWVLGVNLWGVIHGVSVFVPHIIAAGEGHIVNTASMAGLVSPPFMGPYNVSKHGVVTLSETLYHELAMTHPNIGVSVVCPSWVKTQIHNSARNRPTSVDSTPERTSEVSSMIESLIAGGIEPSEVAESIVSAVMTRQLYVLTHDEVSVAVRQRAEAIATQSPPRMVMPS